MDELEENNQFFETIEGKVHRVVFHNSENGYSVIQVMVLGEEEPVTVVGNAPELFPEEHIEVKGNWHNDRKFGRQFKAKEINISQPKTLKGIEKYLSSGIIKGIRKRMAKRLIETFGKEVFHIIEKEPQKLQTIPGIGRKTRERITRDWDKLRVVRNIMVFLGGHDIGPSYAFKIHKKYGDDAIDLINENPYRLTLDIHGIGFKKADQLAHSMGIPSESRIRAEAGLRYFLSEMSSRGHSCCLESELIDNTSQLLGINRDLVQEALDREIVNKRLVSESGWIYLEHLYRSEIGCVRYLISLMKSSPLLPEINTDKATEWVLKETGIELAPNQAEAVKLALKHNLLVITGGPGVGKTTIIDSIIRIYKEKEKQVVLCAPTGRAAKKLEESTNHYAKTIHRLLEFDPDTGGFKRGQENPLSGDLFVVDEVSMLDLNLAFDLLSAIPPGSCLILVGDKDQLPSVGPGMVLGDLINSGVVPVVRLTEIFRQAAESQIIVNAHRINNGQMPLIENSLDDSDFFFAKADDPENGVKLIVELVSERIPKRFHYNPFRDIQVLTPMNKGTLGVINLNRELQNALNPPGIKSSIERFGNTYQVGDKVMQTENNYNKDVFNGNIGFIEKVDEEEGEISVEFDGRSVEYEIGELDELVPAYAISIHKSQGSEYPAVVIVTHTQHYNMLQRNLLYTAITRGKELVILVGNKKAIAIASNRSEVNKRYSTLAERLRLEYNEAHM